MWPVRVRCLVKYTLASLSHPMIDFARRTSVLSKRFGRSVVTNGRHSGTPRSAASGACIGGAGGELEHEVLTVKPGPGSYFQDVAFVHKPSKTLVLCDSLWATTGE